MCAASTRPPCRHDRQPLGAAGGRAAPATARSASAPCVREGPEVTMLGQLSAALAGQRHTPVEMGKTPNTALPGAFQGVVNFSKPGDYIAGNAAAYRPRCRSAKTQNSRDHSAPKGAQCCVKRRGCQLSDSVDILECDEVFGVPSHETNAPRELMLGASLPAGQPRPSPLSHRPFVLSGRASTIWRAKIAINNLPEMNA